jgi:fatty-acyl-CoA synthase
MGDSETWHDLTVPGLLVRAARRWPDHLALVTPRQTYTYKELLGNVQETVRGLLELGVGQSDRVATLFGTRGEWIILQYAVSFLRAILVPLNTRFRSEEIRNALAKVQATILVTMDRDGSQDILARVMEACPELASAQKGAIKSESLPHLRRVVCFSPAGHRPECCLDWSSLQSDGELPTEMPVPLSPESTAIVLFTTGSTGQPKAVMLSHQNLIGHAHYLSQFLKMQPGDRYLNVLPLFHVAGYAQSVLLNVYAGSTLYLVDRFKPDEILDAMAQHRITAWAAMPIIVQRVLDQARGTPAALCSLRKQHGVSPELWDRVRQETKMTVLTRMYGLTESAGLVTMSRPGEKSPVYWRASVGLPLPGVTVRIVDPETHQEMPVGQVGEVTFKGWNCFQGYWDDSQATAAAIDREGYCHTGDQGFADADGCLHLLGRYKEIVKTGGENVSALEVELFLAQCILGMKSVCVVGVPDATWGEVVTAVIEPEPGSTISPESIQAACVGRMASFKIPKHVLFITRHEWPLTASGKIERQKLREWAAEQLSTRGRNHSLEERMHGKS